MKTSVCIPVYNEKTRIGETAKTLSRYMSENFSEYEIIFADDGSKDGSADIVRALDLPFVRVVGYPENMGKGYAVRTAFLAADGDIMIFTDCDLAYGCEVIKMVADRFEAEPETDIVLGSRSISDDGYEGYTFIRKLASKSYLRLVSAIGGLKISDSQCGCKGFRGELAKKIFSNCTVNRFAFDFEAILIADKMGAKFSELPVRIINHGESKVNVISDSFKMFKDLMGIKKRVKKLNLTETAKTADA